MIIRTDEDDDLTGFQSNRPQVKSATVKSAPVKSAPSQIGPKMKVKSASPHQKKETNKDK